jgi:hypothetical protein
MSGRALGTGILAQDVARLEAMQESPESQVVARGPWVNLGWDDTTRFTSLCRSKCRVVKNGFGDGTCFPGPHRVLSGSWLLDYGHRLVPPAQKLRCGKLFDLPGSCNGTGPNVRVLSRCLPQTSDRPRCGGVALTPGGVVG